MSKELLQQALESKSVSAKRGHAEAGVAFVTYDGAAGDLNALSEYVHRLEGALRSHLSAPPADSEQARDARRYLAFFNAGLPITFMGVDYFNKADLDAAIDSAIQKEQPCGHDGPGGEVTR